MLRRKKKWSKWERDRKRENQKHGIALKEANRALTVVIPFVSEYGQQRQTVVRAHNLVAGLLARFKAK